MIPIIQVGPSNHIPSKVARDVGAFSFLLSVKAGFSLIRKEGEVHKSSGNYLDNECGVNKHQI